MMVEGAAMRTFLILLAASAAVASPSAAATRNFGITGFDKIRVEGPYKVRLTNGVAPFARATGGAAALDRVTVSVQGSTLVVQQDRSGWSGYPGQDVGPVEIEVGTHELGAAYLNGSGVLAIDKVKGLLFNLSVQGSGVVSIGQADIDQLTVAVGGSGGATLAGRAGKTTAIIRGMSSLDAAQLNSKDATIAVDGAGTVKAAVSNSAKIEGGGPATIALSGSPSCTVRVNGSATITGCKPGQ